MLEQGCILHACSVAHARNFPQQYRFAYQIFSILIDIDQLHQADQASWLFATNRFAAIAFHERDHGPVDGSALRPWINDQLASRGLPEPATVLLQCMPRVFGYVFNPISLWYCFDHAGNVLAILVEVNNTFGEKHCYLLHEAGRAMSWPVRQAADKCFHVSPFIGMQARYQFRISDPRAKLGVVINEFQNNELMLIATQTGLPRALTFSNLARLLCRLPLSTFKVMAAIHWQALRIWWRGGKFHKKPPPPANLIS